MINFLNNGGPLFMYPTLLILIIIVILLIRTFTSKPENHEKNIKVINTLAAFVVAWGFSGQIIGLMDAFDSIHTMGSINPGVLAGGLRVSFLSPIFGLFTFLIAKLGVAILHWTKK